MYLLSLTELARVPFSLVDEINQGMDPRAERAVHNQLVEVTCRAEAGQCVRANTILSHYAQATH